MMNMQTLWTAEEDQVDREWIRSQLYTSTCKVVFEKVNGELREMFCTLDPSLTPTVEVKDDSDNLRPKKKPNEQVVVAWDLDKKDWRSFRLDKVKEFMTNVNFDG